MKRMLIIYPHWPPSNLVGVHRVRLIANELHALGWRATVLTVDAADYEEPSALETLQLVAPEVEVSTVRALPVRKILGKRLVGDIGLRGFSALRKKAREILSDGSVSFIWFSLPSWYPSLMGYLLSKRFGVPFGLDYQDPWVYALAPHQKGFNRATATIAIARVLEPLALRNVALVSGISEGYVQGVRERYPKLGRVPFVTCQLGFSRRDHFIELPDFTLPFSPMKRTFVYAGALWSMGAPLFKLWLQGLALLKKQPSLNNVEFLFIGTGNSELPGLQELANNLGLEDVVREIPERMSYLQVQQILRSCAGALVIGSIEPHYSASKIFQCLITAPRVMGFFHEASEGASILAECHADSYFVPYHPTLPEEALIDHIASTISKFTNPNQPWDPDLSPLDAHTSASNAQKLIAAIEGIIH